MPRSWFEQNEAFGALSRKLEGYLRLAAGWAKEQELTAFPNLLIIVPEGVREGEVGSALRNAIGNLHVGGSLATSFPLYVASEDQLVELGVLGAAWEAPARRRRPPFARRPAGPDPATSSSPLDASVATSPTPMPATVVGSPRSRPRPDSAPCRPDMLLDAAARRRAKDRA